MERMIDGELFVGKPSPNRWHVSLRKLANGHREHAVRRATDWTCLGFPFPESTPKPEPTPEELEERAALNVKRAARRAKSMVRLRCKQQGLDQLLTLTYRENMQDKGRAERDMRAFLRLMRKTIPDFAYVAVPETQKRGAWHWHMAVRRLPKVLAARNGVMVKSFNVVRALWRRVVGHDNGNVDVGKLQRRVAASCARCAAYVSKYVMKDYALVEDGAKRYWSSRCEIPRATCFDLVSETLAALIEQVTLDAVQDGGSIASFYVCPFRDSFFVAVEPPGGR